MEKENNRIKQSIETIFENIDNLTKINTVIGEPIYSGEDMIIPLTDVNCYTLFAGGEYGKMNIMCKNKNFPYSIGNGSIVNLKPSAFLIKNGKGEYSIINTASNSYEKVAESIIQYMKCILD